MASLRPTTHKRGYYWNRSEQGRPGRVRGPVWAQTRPRDGHRQTFLSGVLRQRGAGGEECWLRSGASPPVQSQVLGTSPHPLSVITELLTVKAGE